MVKFQTWLSTYLGTVARKVTKHPPSQKLDVRALLSNIRPFGSSEPAQPRPMIGFQITHTVQQDVERNSKKVMPHDNVWVGLVDDHY